MAGHGFVSRGGAHPAPHWDEFASRGVFAPRLEGMKALSGSRRPPGREGAVQRQCQLQDAPKELGAPLGRALLSQFDRASPGALAK